MNLGLPNSETRTARRRRKRFRNNRYLSQGRQATPGSHDSSLCFEEKQAINPTKYDTRLQDMRRKLA